MASIYKRKQDMRKKRAPWYIGYATETGKRRTVKGFTDKGETEQLAARLEHEVMLRRRGLIDPEQEALAAKRKTLLSDHVVAFKRSLGSNTEKHVKLTMGRVNRIIDGLEAKTIKDLSSEAVELFLQELAEEEKLGNRTYNHYVQAIDGFCNWLVEKKRASSNPLAGLKRLNTEVDIRHPRRALDVSEIRQLVASARESGEDIQCFDGETRARIYTLAYMTGLRRNELGSLTKESFNLTANPPTVTVQAGFSKHRRRDVIPLHPELVTLLQTWLEAYSQGDVLFPKLGRRRTWLMVKKDLERVGIAYVTAEGIADFHAAGRHSHITELLRNGATLPEAKELARHSDIRMTMKYTHIGIHDQAAAIKQLPWQSSPPEKAPESIATPRECSGSDSSGVDCHNGSLDDPKEGVPRNDATLVGDEGCREMSPSDGDIQRWRRRELNPRPAIFPRQLLRV
jgi:site-specific recombinase XerD